MSAKMERAEKIGAMMALMIVTGITLQMMQYGQWEEVREALMHAWHHVCHFVTDVTAAEICASALFRMLGVAESA